MEIEELAASPVRDDDERSEAAGSGAHGGQAHLARELGETR
jgi:hypothetical protein